MGAYREIRGLRKTGRGSPFWSLLVTQLKTDYGVRGLSEKLGLGKKGRNAYIYLALIAIAFAPMIGLMYTMAETLADQAISMGQPGLPVLSAVMAGQFMVLFVGISGVMSTLYYSDDLERLQALPLTPRQIMMAKVMAVYLGQVLLALVFTGPFFAALGQKVGSQIPEFWPYAFLIHASLPGIPLALSVFFVVVLMRITKGAKKRDFFRVVFGLVFFALLIGFQMLNANFARYGPERILTALSERNGLVQVVSGYYPLFNWGASALTGETFLSRAVSLLLFVGVSLGSVLFAVGVGERWFLGGAGKEYGTLKPKNGTGTTESRVKPAFFARQRPASSAILLKDHLVLVRTPNFILVSLTNLMVVPLLLAISFLAGEADLQALISVIRNSTVSDLIPLFVAGLHGATVSLNQVASTMLSREGATFWVSKAIPVSPKDQVRGKLRYAMLFSVVQLLILMVTVGIVLKPGAVHMAVIAVIGLAAAWPVSAIALINDIFSPKLSWTNPQSAMKGNFMTMVAALLGTGYLFLVGAVVRFAHMSGFSAVTLYGLTGAILVLSGSALTWFLCKFAEKRYPEIEV